MQPDNPIARAELDRLWARGTAFLGCRVALMGGAMSWVSERHLVSAISNAGGFGVIACGSMNPDQMVARGVLSASQMAVVNDRLAAVKRSLAAQAPPQTPPRGAAAAKAACGTGAGSPPAP